ncbi:MAG: Na+/H+ antiporter subunit E [Chloroflexi bacterium]|nr:Na+/H+ antiporter subunit E [Chloroflexota bacterium]
MSFFTGNIGLALVWMFLTGEFSAANFVMGVILGYGLMLLTRRTFASERYIQKVNGVIRFLGFFLYELLTANIQVAKMVLRPQLNIKPGIVAVPLDVRTDAEITLLSNLITLTPGSLSLELSPNGQLLYVHGIYVDDEQEFIRRIKSGLEARTLEVTR